MSKVLCCRIEEKKGTTCRREVIEDRRKEYAPTTGSCIHLEFTMHNIDPFSGQIQTHTSTEKKIVEKKIDQQMMKQ